MKRIALIIALVCVSVAGYGIEFMGILAGSPYRLKDLTWLYVYPDWTYEIVTDTVIDSGKIARINTDEQLKKLNKMENSLHK